MADPAHESSPHGAPAHDEHAHAHGEHHHEESFFVKYFWSTDHKMIAKQYMFTGMFMAMMQGDLDGQVIGLNSIMANQAQLWNAKEVRPLVQFGRKTRHPLLRDVPLASELTKDQSALAVIAFAVTWMCMGLIQLITRFSKFSKAKR